MTTPSSPPVATAHEKIRPDHLQRWAVVYVRQSTPDQVRNHRESARVQRGLERRAQDLGWPKTRVRVLDGDQGESAALADHRSGFRDLLVRVKAGEVGIIFATEVSRLARNNVDWNRLTYYCAHLGVLLADETHVFDPALPQESHLLGI